MPKITDCQKRKWFLPVCLESSEWKAFINLPLVFRMWWQLHDRKVSHHLGLQIKIDRANVVWTSTYVWCLTSYLGSNHWFVHCDCNPSMRQMQPFNLRSSTLNGLWRTKWRESDFEWKNSIEPYFSWEVQKCSAIFSVSFRCYWTGHVILNRLTRRFAWELGWLFYNVVNLY